MDILTEALKETPWWVYVLFIYLVIIGLTATRPRTFSLKKLFIFPLILTIWNILWLLERLQAHYGLFLFWPFGLIVGGYLGWIMVRSWKISIEKSKQSITLPPTWSTLILILLIFAIRYFFVYNYEVHPEIAPHLFLADALISGVITGIFIGRAFHLYNKYLKF
ncbi:MAG TPA: hypothetical protein VLE89_01620 [Chlamydiales bacterium]|nr:hypothetical protein [Chlamydiales bacterium]